MIVSRLTSRLTKVATQNLSTEVQRVANRQLRRPNRDCSSWAWSVPAALARRCPIRAQACHNIARARTLVGARRCCLLPPRPPPLAAQIFATDDAAIKGMWRLGMAAMLAYLASEDPMLLSCERVDPSRLTADRAAAAAAPEALEAPGGVGACGDAAAGGGRGGAPTSFTVARLHRLIVFHEPTPLAIGSEIALSRSKYGGHHACSAC